MPYISESKYADLILQNAKMEEALEEIGRTRAEILEEAARLIEAHQETNTTSIGFHLTPRSHGNLTGLSFAAAIRRLAET